MNGLTGCRASSGWNRRDDTTHQDARGGFHRDIKPSNILIEGLKGTQWDIKVSDFGLAQDPNVTSTITVDGFGTPAYKAPELFQGAPFTKSADIYSLGITLLEMLTAKTSLHDVNPQTFGTFVSKLIGDMTNLDKARRPTAKSIITCIDGYFEEQRREHQAKPREIQKQDETSWAGIALGGLVVVGLVGLGAALFSGKKVEQRPNREDMP